MPVCCCKSASSVHSDRMDWGSLGSTRRSIASIAWPELTPGAGFRLIVADGIQVVPDDHHRAAHVADRGDDCRSGPCRRCSLRTRSAGQVADLLAEVGVALDVDLPGAAEPVEVVDVQRAQVDLQGVEQLGDRDAGQLGLVAVDVQVQPGRIGPEAGEEPRRALRVDRRLDDARRSGWRRPRAPAGPGRRGPRRRS